MLPNIDPAVYGKFKKSGYRKRNPVNEVGDIVQLGYLDVNRTISGIGGFPKLSRSIKQCVIAFIAELQNSPPIGQSEFDRLHHQYCGQCDDLHSNGVEIHYGQAQKIANMSLKYWYNEFALGNSIGFPRNNMEYFFHLPIDNQILSHLVGCCSFRKPTTLPWSKWGYDHYIAFQTELRGRLINNHKPLEIDYMLWNERNQALGNAIRPA